MDRQIWWAVLRERTTYDHACVALEKVAMNAGLNGYRKIELPYMRVDAARHGLSLKFLEESRNPNDVLVMLDNDHVHPPDVIARLVENVSDRAGDVGVIGALAFMRGQPFSPCFFVRASDGFLHAMVPGDTNGIYRGDMVGHGAIAIARWVFEALIESGYNAPFWRYQYQTEGVPKRGADGLHHYAPGSVPTPSEDMYFGEICEKAGIGHWCDMRFEIPHIILSTVGKRVWEEYMRENPEPMVTGTVEGKA